MTLPTSGQLRVSQINTELGNPTTAAVNIGSSTLRSLAGVASGQIRLSNFYGKSNAPNLSWPTSTYISADIANEFAVAGVTLHSDGRSTNMGSGSVSPGNWLSEVASGIGGSFEVRQVPISGSAASGPTAFERVSRSISFSIRRNTKGVTRSGFDIEIQPIGEPSKRITRRIVASVEITGGGGTPF